VRPERAAKGARTHPIFPTEKRALVPAPPDRQSAVSAAAHPDGARGHCSWRQKPARRGIFQQGFGGFGRQMIGDAEEAIFGHSADVGQPIGRHPDRQQRIVIQRGEQFLRHRLLLRIRGRRKDKIETGGRRNFLDALAHFHNLDGAGPRMRLDPPALRPGIGVVVMPDIGNQQTTARLVDDQADVPIDAGRPEIRVLTFVDAVQLETVAGRVHLQVEDARLHGLLVQAGEPAEGGSKSIGDQEIHDLIPRTPS
jgi:hypothetical protein